jgi:hypothetical protein
MPEAGTFTPEVVARHVVRRRPGRVGRGARWSTGYGFSQDENNDVFVCLLVCSLHALAEQPGWIDTQTQTNFT